jgi:hypothetical protein
LNDSLEIINATFGGQRSILDSILDKPTSYIKSVGIKKEDAELH